jgi:leader peptidase (prepilin peptidase)/N-methyltransferase
MDWRAVFTRGDAVKSGEVILVAAAASIGIAASLVVATSAVGVAGATLALLMVAVAWIDARTLTIPDELSAVALVLGLVVIVLSFGSEALAPAMDACLRGTMAAAVFYLFRFAYRRLRRREGMGLGDVKLAAVAGVWLDWPNLPIAVEMASVSALGFVLSWRVVSSRPLDPLTRLPFGAFLGPAIWASWLHAQWSM